MKNNFLLLMFLFISLISCNRQEGVLSTYESNNQESNVPVINGKISPGEYISWVDKYYSQKVTIGEITYELKYLPVSYMLLTNQEYSDEKQFQKDLKDNDNSHYFSLKISRSDYSGDPLKSGISSENEYYGRVEYLSFGIASDVVLIENGDTLPCTVNSYERSFNVGPYITEMLTFSKGTEKPVDRVLVYNDRLFGNGPVKFRFGKEKFIQSPQIGI